MLLQWQLQFPSWSALLPGGVVWVKPLPLRTKSLGTKVSDAEYAQLEALASARGQSISELIRSVLLEEIASPNGHGP